MAFVQRIITLEFKLGQGAFGEDGADTVKLEGLRCSVNIVTQGIGFAKADVQIWGMSLDLMNKLTVLNKVRYEQQRFNQITISAGDANGVAMCFGGTIREAWADGRQPPDMMFHVSADAAMFALSKPVPPISFRGSVDAALVLSGIAAQMGMSLENNGVSATLDNPYWPGSLKSQLEKVCEAANCEYTIDEVGHVLAVWPKGSARENHPAVLLSPDTGLVGYPSFTQSGVQCTTLYNPSMIFNAPIEIQSQFAPANGRWKVQALNHRLDSQIPGGQWFTDIECSFLDHPLPAA